MSARAKTSANDWATRQAINTARRLHVEANGTGCELCGTVPKTRGLQWDHDHKTGAHRGWLCWRCNNALPNWISYLWLLKAARYLFRAKHGSAHGPIELDLLIEAEEE